MCVDCLLWISVEARHWDKCRRNDRRSIKCRKVLLIYWKEKRNHWLTRNDDRINRTFPDILKSIIIEEEPQESSPASPHRFGCTGINWSRNFYGLPGQLEILIILWPGDQCSVVFRLTRTYFVEIKTVVGDTLLFTQTELQSISPLTIDHPSPTNWPICSAQVEFPFRHHL